MSTALAHRSLTDTSLQKSSEVQGFQSERRAEFLKNLVEKVSPSLKQRPEDSETFIFIEDDDLRSPGPSVIKFPEYTPTEMDQSHSFYALQEWEGHVVELSEGDFTGLLYDVRSSDRAYSEEAIIPLDLVSPDDLPYLSVGSVFRFLIGYNQSLGGPRTRSTLVYLRRTLAPTEPDKRFGDLIADFFADAD